MNYFKIFDIDPKYDIDQKLLQKKYFTLQLKYHPDRSKNESDRYNSLINSTLVNKAFKTIQDDYLRAEYLLKTRGFLTLENKLTNSLSHKQLEKILESYEILEDIKSLPDLYKIKQYKINDYQELVLKIAEAFTKNNFKEALDLTVSLKYLNSLIQNIKLKIRNADN